MKYREGQTVTVKTREEIIKEYGSLNGVPFGLNSRMEEVFGKTFTVDACIKMTHPNHQRYGYKIYLKEIEYSWHDDMFKDSNMTKKVYDVLRGTDASI
jgi:hypothetical protein